MSDLVTVSRADLEAVMGYVQGWRQSSSEVDGARLRLAEQLHHKLCHKREWPCPDACSKASVNGVRRCPCCGPGFREPKWSRSRGPDCMYAICGYCGFGYDIGWAVMRPDYFPDEIEGRDSQ